MKKIQLMDIAEDIWYEIFLRLPLNAVYKFKCVSKVWFSVLSNPSFISRWNILNTSLLPWVLVYYASDHSPRFAIAYQDSHSQFVSHNEIGFYLRFLNQVGEKLCILASSNGLVLCSTRIFYNQTYYVCNPLTKKWVLLPAPPSKSGLATTTGFVCDERASLSLGSTARYKVIRIPEFGEGNKFEVEVFSSDLGEWNTHAVSCPRVFHWNLPLNYDNIVTHNGVLYWFQKLHGKILAVSVDRNIKDGICGNECRWIKLPDQAVDGECYRCIGESEGMICYAIINVTERSLSLWVLEGEDWYMVHKDIGFRDILAEIESWLISRGTTVNLVRQIRILGFNPVDKNVVILCCEKYLWAYNSKTKGYEQLSFMGNNRRIPHMAFLTFAFMPRPTIIPPVSW